MIGASPGAAATTEVRLVERLIALGWRGSRSVLLGPGDDGAVLRGGLVLSTDLCVEGVHYRPGWISDREVGFRAAAAALSDMAAMGATPIALLVSMALLGDAREALRLQEGVRRAGDRVSAPIVGGDVSRSLGATVLDIVAVGRTAEPVPRSGARAGHGVWVSGALGGAGAAVARWSRGSPPAAAARDRFAAPPDRVAVGRALAAEGIARSMIDVSDGLVADAERIARASSARIRLRTDLVPVDAEAGADLDLALGGGEDYELIFTAPDGAERRIRELGREHAVSLARIGAVEVGAGVVLEDANGTRSPAGRGFDHFAAGARGGSAGPAVDSPPRTSESP